MLTIAAQPHIHVILGRRGPHPALSAALDRMDARASFTSLHDAPRRDISRGCDAVLIVGLDATAGDPERLAAWLAAARLGSRALLVLHTDGSLAGRITAPPTTPIFFARESDDDDLAARLATLVQMRKALESLTGVAADRVSAERAASALQQQLRTAGALQREFLPRTTPALDGFRVTVLHRPAGHVSGDVYDIRRLGPDHTALAIADAEGNGLFAALLTVFIKRALLGVERDDGARRVLSPDEVLARLNEELIEANFSQCQYVAAVYALLHAPTRTVTIARAGSPHPILRRADGLTRLLRLGGPVAGIAYDQRFDIGAYRLAPGDTVLLFSDGVQQLIAAKGAVAASCSLTTSQRDQTFAPDEAITATPWFASLADAGVEAALEHLASRHDTLRRAGCRVDDLTVLALTATA